MFNAIKSYLFDSAEEKKLKAQLESIRNIRVGLEKDTGRTTNSSTDSSRDSAVMKKLSRLSCLHVEK